MILGMDVSHGPLGQLDIPSIAAVIHSHPLLFWNNCLLGPPLQIKLNHFLTAFLPWAPRLLALVVGH